MSTTIEPRTAVVTVYTGDYLDRIRHLERLAEAAKDAAEDAGPRIASDVPEYLELAREHDALVKEAEESALHIRVHALPRKAWKSIVAEHPPRSGEGVADDDARSDAAVGVNEDTFKDALVAASTDQADEIIDQLSDIDFDRVYITAFSLNRGTTPDPKASLVSRLTQKNDETSS